MKYTFLIFASLISFATFAQKKPTKKSLPPPSIMPPPAIVREKEQLQDIRNPFADEISFSWKNLPDTLTTITTKDIFEKTYTFRNYGKM
ncbi:hypothetical protein EZ449_03610 [Pedobacter frigidisoli]|uniref:Uncharacterized protein n=1 Tax=Pedobacter frigidisoli TaxID=2530455 RepID=A0A4R0P934_9SPHI|nr:hypothetical protein [Pedobacter frigidisoli]TCD12116.1 hypothetical protein EZ449_03610 [Pedobacter frigidisoli]